MMKIDLKKFQISNDEPFTLIAGPCVIESREHAIKMADKINKICKELNVNYIFKSSFDKANRSSINSSRGVGFEESLKIFERKKGEKSM